MTDRAAWKNFKKQMTAKRGTKKNSSGVQILERESITVQLLSADHHHHHQSILFKMKTRQPRTTES
jgi:hypothetical protein